VKALHPTLNVDLLVQAFDVTQSHELWKRHYGEIAYDAKVLAKSEVPMSDIPGAIDWKFVRRSRGEKL